MAISFTLVYARPDHLRYIVGQDGVISSPPVAADGLATLGNDGGATPDLQTDMLGAAGRDISGLPLLALINARRNGFGPLPAAALTQAQARALFFSDDAAAAVLTNDLVLRAITTLTPRDSAVFPPQVQWTIDANVDGQGDPVIEVQSTVGVAATAYLDIKLRDTYDL